MPARAAIRRKDDGGDFITHVDGIDEFHVGAVDGRETEIDLSARLATSASVPAELIERPDGCLPPSIVLISLGGFASRSMT